MILRACDLSMKSSSDAYPMVCNNDASLTTLYIPYLDIMCTTAGETFSTTSAMKLNLSLSPPFPMHPSPPGPTGEAAFTVGRDIQSGTGIEGESCGRRKDLMPSIPVPRVKQPAIPKNHFDLPLQFLSPLG